MLRNECLVQTHPANPRGLHYHHSSPGNINVCYSGDWRSTSDKETVLYRTPPKSELACDKHTYGEAEIFELETANNESVSTKIKNPLPLHDSNDNASRVKGVRPARKTYHGVQYIFVHPNSVPICSPIEIDEAHNKFAKE